MNERGLTHVIQRGNVFELPPRPSRALVVRETPGLPAKINSDAVLGAVVIVGAALLLNALFSEK